MRKKIVFLMPNFDVIGAQKMCLNIIENLDISNYSCSLIVQDEVGLLLNEPGYSSKHLVLKSNSSRGIYSKIQTLFTPIKLAIYLNKLRPNIIISIAPGMNIVLLISILFLRFKKPFVIIEEHQHLSTSLQMDKNSHTIFMKFFYKYCIKIYNIADCLKVVSQSSKNDFVNNWGIDEKIIKVINPPINTLRLIEKSKHFIPEQILEFIGENNYIFSLGRIESQKGFDLLIEAYLLITDTQPNLKLIICGDGTLRNHFIKYIIDRNLVDKVLFTGYLDNPYPLFKKASMFCLTSIWEGMPVVIMESMILNCPVISVNCPSGPNEMIINEKSGLLVNRNVKDLAFGIQYILDNPKLVESWKKAAYDSAKEWSIEKYICSLKTII